MSLLNAVSPLSTTVCGVHFPSILLNASGAFNVATFDELYSLKISMGGLVAKTVFNHRFDGNDQPRTVELPGIGMLNSIGIQNLGLAYLMSVDVPKLAQHGLPVIVSISAESVAEFAEMAATIQAHANIEMVSLLELNLSCPNIDAGGVSFGVHPDMVKAAVAAVIKVFNKPVFAKLTPNVTDIVSIGRAAVEGGAHGLTAINTVLGVAINVKTKRPSLNRVSGGYSGPGIKPIALNAVWQLHKNFPNTPIMAAGGISTATDVLEFLMAGASLIQVGTIAFRNPMVYPQMTEELLAYAEAENLNSLASLTGCAHSPTQG